MCVRHLRAQGQALFGQLRSQSYLIALKCLLRKTGHKLWKKITMLFQESFGLYPM